MTSISQTIAKLNAMLPGAFQPLSPANDRLSLLRDFGSNPGDLDARIYIPNDLPAKAPLIVVLHGCGQDAAGYDHGSGWSTLADRHGFVLLYPQQRVTNNPNRCFNWFQPEDMRRDAGEALSIRQMIGKVVEDYGIDADRIFITGLSAGGAMTSVMLATCPEVFAGGAIIAGLPYGSAAGVPEALERMRGQGIPSATSLGELVRRASDHNGPLPTISVWHGTGDMTVTPANAEAIVTQWRNLHGVLAKTGRDDSVNGYPHRVWADDSGRDVIEEYSISGMAHGTPVAPGGDDGCGASAPYMLDVGISSTRHIAAFWGIAPVPELVNHADTKPDLPNPPLTGAEIRARASPPTSSIAAGSSGISTVIEQALRSAGLMR
ncbi:MAG: PHB depolymerase family esterase [Sphingobium sp.]